MGGPIKIGSVTIDTIGQLKVGSSNVQQAYVGSVLIFPATIITTTTTTLAPTTTTTSTTTSTTTLAPTTTTSTTTSTTTLAPTTTTTTSTTTSTTTLAPTTTTTTSTTTSTTTLAPTTTTSTTTTTTLAPTTTTSTTTSTTTLAPTTTTSTTTTTTTTMPTINMTLAATYTGVSEMSIDLNISNPIPDSATLMFNWCTDSGASGFAEFDMNSATTGDISIPSINLSSTGNNALSTSWGSYSYVVSDSSGTTVNQFNVKILSIAYSTADTTTKVVIDFPSVDDACANPSSETDYCLANC